MQYEPVQSAQLKQRAQRGSITSNRVAAGDWMWLPEQPLAGAHALVAVVSQLQLATVLRTYPNGAIRLQLFDMSCRTCLCVCPSPCRGSAAYRPSCHGHNKVKPSIYNYSLGRGPAERQNQH